VSIVECKYNLYLYKKKRLKLLLLPNNNNNNNILLMEKIRKRIKSIRLEKEYTQDYIGERLGINQRTYHRIENGKSQLKVETLLKLALILEVDATYFLEG
jgi:DNA-binding XRE family transcriptional regulator